jgi:hypothetical protein
MTIWAGASAEVPKRLTVLPAGLVRPRVKRFVAHDDVVMPLVFATLQAQPLLGVTESTCTDLSFGRPLRERKKMGCVVAITLLEASRISARTYVKEPVSGMLRTSSYEVPLTGMSVVTGPLPLFVIHRTSWPAERPWEMDKRTLVLVAVGATSKICWCLIHPTLKVTVHKVVEV